MPRYIFICLLVFSYTLSACLSAAESYEVKFEGAIAPHVRRLLESASQLIVLKDTPPATIAGVQRRAEEDIPNLLQALHSYAYFNARIELAFEFTQKPIRVIVNIYPGTVYRFAAFTLSPDSSKNDHCYFSAYETIPLEKMGIVIGNPAFPKDILAAEEHLLNELAIRGYPLAKIQARDVAADQVTQTVNVTLTIDSGPLTYFGNTKIQGNQAVKSAFFDKKITWELGDVYDPAKIEMTQRAIEASGLFSSIAISPVQELGSCHELPIIIEVDEAKHRSIGWGLAYTTQRGIGLTGEWEHRNIRGLGEKLSLEGVWWKDQQEATILYVKPDFLMPSQDLLLSGQYEFESTKGYSESSISFSAIVERQLNAQTRFSYGGMYKNLHDTRAKDRGDYNLMKAPLHIRWSNANNLIDPTKGFTIHAKLIPTLQIIQPFAYCINTLTFISYYPITCDERYVLASKASFGSIFGSSRRTIPASERFYEGSENSLRGYRYLTVSPLNCDNKPIGGRSLILYSLELRVRATETIGWTTFYDLGNVYSEPLPHFNRKLLQSVGFGIRYHTPVGPLRCDLAVPLSPRHGLDRRYQIYFSIGQAF